MPTKTVDFPPLKTDVLSQMIFAFSPRKYCYFRKNICSLIRDKIG